MQDRDAVYQKNEQLAEILASYRRVLIAFSGGVDSTFLLARAKEVLGVDNVLAVTAASDTFPEREFQAACRLAEQLGVQHLRTRISELSNARYAANNPDRCYHCKSGLYRHLQELVQRYGDRYVICDGANEDDRHDYRPGRRAAAELGVRSPLQEARLTKEEIRFLSREMGLPTWNKPSFACLASRIPYGVRITPDIIRRLDEAESFLLGLGFSQVRVRYHEEIARIELTPVEFPLALAHRERIVQTLKALGFTYVTLDLAGYQTGSMNALLKKTSIQHHGQTSS